MREKWCKGPKDIANQLVPKCDRADNLPMKEIVSFFNRTCGLDQRVAVIGSAFVFGGSGKNVLVDDATSQAFARYFDNFTPSRKLLAVLRKIHHGLQNGYAGVHIRFKDNMKIDDCNSTLVQKAYNHVLHELENKNVTKDTQILIGNSNRAALRCFDYHSKGDYHATTVNEIINSDAMIQKLVDEIKTEKSTVYLLLDQLLIGIADVMVVLSVDFGDSTFQDQMKARHHYRSDILSTL